MISPRKLRRARKRARLSVQDLADQLATTYQTVWRWERGDCAPRPRTMQALAKLLRVQVADLLVARWQRAAEVAGMALVFVALLATAVWS